MNEKTRVFIVGSGVIGLSVGIGLLKLNSKLQVSIFEKEPNLGYHASGRNSGVIHAGFYYSPDSLKAKFCREGNKALTDLITRNNLSLKKTGKIVVTQNENQVQDLIELQRRGDENGVNLELLDSSDLNKFEPLAQTVSAFLWSPNTSVGSPSEVIQAMAFEYENLGGILHFNQIVEDIGEGHITLDKKQICSDLVINCSGTQALRFAQQMGIGTKLAQLPFIGLYRYTEHSELSLRTLVYPVPDKNYPFLGVHFTLSSNGKVKIGPTAIPVLGSEQYRPLEGVNIIDIRHSIASLKALTKNNFTQTLNLAKTELPNLYTKHLIDKAAELVPTSRDVRTWKKYKPGIRAQLVETDTGSFVQDFKLAKTDKVLHVLNSVSPGWTSSLPFGSWVAEQGLEMLG